MKQNTSAPSLFSVRIGESQNDGPVEWSTQCVFTQDQTQLGKIDVSPALSPKGRRVPSSFTSSTSSSSISSSSSSSFISFGFGTYDDTDDSTTEGEDDPIISFESLSLGTQRKTVDAIPTAHSNSVRTEYKHTSMKSPQRGDNQDYSPRSRIGEKYGAELARRSYPDQHPMLSPLDPKDQDRQEKWKNDDTLTPTKLSYNIFSGHSDHQRRRRPTSRKFSIRKTSFTVPSNVGSAGTLNESAKTFRPKRLRGGSDFAFAQNEGNGTTSSSPSDRRKRRRTNRNRAMGADDFDSILSQINTTGSL